VVNCLRDGRGGGSDDDEVGCGDGRCLRVARGVVSDLAIYLIFSP
jgi:hypothetical protein